MKEHINILCLNLWCVKSYFMFCSISVMNQFVAKLDSRYEKTKKPGTGSTVKRERMPGLPSTSSPPICLPSWMVDPSYKTTPFSSITTVCVRESSLDPTHDPSTGKYNVMGVVGSTPYRGTSPFGIKGFHCRHFRR